MSAVSSRAFQLYGEILYSDKHKNIPMLLPVIDMCNHSFAPNARIVQEQNMNSQNMSIKASSSGVLYFSKVLLLDIHFCTSSLVELVMHQ